MSAPTVDDFTHSHLQSPFPRASENQLHMIQLELLQAAGPLTADLISNDMSQRAPQSILVITFSSSENSKFIVWVDGPLPLLIISSTAKIYLFSYCYVLQDLILSAYQVIC